MEVNNETRQFIEYALKVNLPKDTVYSQLRLQGYPDESIEKLISHFRDAAQEQAGAPESKAGSFKTIMNIIFIIVLMAAGALVFLIYPVENLGKSGIMKLPWISAIVVGLIGGTLYTLWSRRKEKRVGLFGIFSVISFGVLAFWIFDSLSYVPGLLPDSFTGPFREYLFRPKFFLAGFVGGVGGILLTAVGLITLLTGIVKRTGTKKVAQAALMAMYGFASLYLLGMMLGSGNMDGAIQYMQTHQTYSLILDIFFGGTFASYALKFLTTPDSLAQDMVRSKSFTVSDQQGFTHWVVAILISVMALGLAGVAWWYERNKEESTTVAATNIATNTNALINTNLNTNNVVSNSNKKTNSFYTADGVHGCNVSEGFAWCENKNKCLRTWEEKCLNINAWKEYNNTEYNFSMKYPPQWSIEEQTFSNTNNPYQMIILMQSNEPGKDIEVFSSERDIGNGPTPPTTIEINGIKLKFGIEYGMVDTKSAYFPIGNKFILLTWGAGGGSSDDIVQQTILSTFRFLD